MMICATFGLTLPSDSGEEVEIVKSLQTNKQTDIRTDAGQMWSGELQQLDWKLFKHGCLEKVSDMYTYIKIKNEKKNNKVISYI